MFAAREREHDLKSFAVVIFLPGVEGSRGQQFWRKVAAVSAVINIFFVVFGTLVKSKIEL